MKIAIIGLGLIGGSLAKAIKAYTGHEVWGADLDESVLAAASRENTIDGVLSASILGQCDIALIALFPKAVVQYVADHQNEFNPQGLVIDCGGVKDPVMHGVNAIRQQHTWQFIGGHPMAGREFCGYFNSQAELFQNASMILTPYEDTSAESMSVASSFFTELGFGRIQVASPAFHDQMIAYTSQLAHIVSSAYVKGELVGRQTGFTAGSFGDMTRVARLNEDMWTQLFMSNQEPLLHELEALIRRLEEYRDALLHQDPETMRQLLKAGREIKEGLN
ncbi:MAG: prephenate dehydrogenase/arogenate dehydrogenase family protein [Clostridia bacterium]|nr:prephenate dehydrogenase/arogenate dehydrogenase family protein [Clostridia bacterium]